VELLSSNINSYSKSIIFQFLQRTWIAHKNLLSLAASQIVTADTEIWRFIRPLSISFKLFAKHFLLCSYWEICLQAKAISSSSITSLKNYVRS